MLLTFNFNRPVNVRATASRQTKSFSALQLAGTLNSHQSLFLNIQYLYH